MGMILSIQPGATGSASLTVADEHTAARVGSGNIGVLATPVLINLFEAAALAACESQLPDGYQSLGTRLDVSHAAATPIGMTITATARVTAVEGRTIRFALEARDDIEMIGEGTHERVVVSVARFDVRVAEKKRRAGLV